MTQTFRPALLGLMPLLALAIVMALFLIGRPGAFRIDPSFDSAPSARPAAPVDAAPAIEKSTALPIAQETVAPARETIAPALPTTMPGSGATAPSATAAPALNNPPQALPFGAQDPLPYPNLPIGKSPAVGR